MSKEKLTQLERIFFQDLSADKQIEILNTYTKWSSSWIEQLNDPSFMNHLLSISYKNLLTVIILKKMLLRKHKEKEKTSLSDSSAENCTAEEFITKVGPYALRTSKSIYEKYQTLSTSPHKIQYFMNYIEQLDIIFEKKYVKQAKQLPKTAPLKEYKILFLKCFEEDWKDATYLTKQDYLDIFQELNESNADSRRNNKKFSIDKSKFQMILKDKVLKQKSNSNLIKKLLKQQTGYFNIEEFIELLTREEIISELQNIGLPTTN